MLARNMVLVSNDVKFSFTHILLSNSNVNNFDYIFKTQENSSKLLVLHKKASA